MKASTTEPRGLALGQNLKVLARHLDGFSPLPVFSRGPSAVEPGSACSLVRDHRDVHSPLQILGHGQVKMQALASIQEAIVQYPSRRRDSEPECPGQRIGKDAGRRELSPAYPREGFWCRSESRESPGPGVERVQVESGAVFTKRSCACRC